MKTKLLFIAGLVMLVSCGQKKTELFSGQNPDGWVVFTDPNSDGDASQTFTVADGLIRISGTPFGYMRTTEKYANFVLHTEWRWSGKPADGGIYVLIQEGDRVWPTGVQCQMKGADMGVLMGGIPMKGVEDWNGFYMKKLDNDSTAEKPAGEWNTTDIACHGGHVSVTINGILVNEADCEATEGYVALQSEGGPMEYRNVYVVKM